MTRILRWLMTALFWFASCFWRAWFALGLWFLRLFTGQAQRSDAPPVQPKAPPAAATLPAPAAPALEGSVALTETPGQGTSPAEPEAPATAKRPRKGKAAVAADAAPDAAAMREGQYTCAFGARRYQLFVPTPVPSNQAAVLRPLIVMLHGCKQNPADFAAGTRMNTLAQAAQCLVLYPAQSRWDNPYGCWNWFSPQHQLRGVGEPAILAGMVQAVQSEYQADARRVYVAGLSAGAAMAVNLAHTYPELFAAVGAHSGLAYGAAYDASSAMQAMKEGHPTPAQVKLALPLILFQGDADTVVHPRNAQALLAQTAWAEQPVEQSQVSENASGLAHTCTRYGAAGQHDAMHHAPALAPALEFWQVKGLGHAWSGGHAQGSFTDPQGPDASAEMLRFFLAHQRGT